MKKKIKNNWIISDYVDTDAFNINYIMDNFSSYLYISDGSKITLEQRKEIVNLLETYPILRILCTAMYHQGYDSF